MIKNKIVTFMLAGMIGLTTFGGITITSYAANTEDKKFSFDNSSSSGTCAWREKNNTTKVYVYPTSGPKGLYTVQGKTGVNGSVADRSNCVAIPQGVQGSITNTVRENNNDWARLKFNRITTGRVVTSGVWSPDSTRNYTIYN